MRNKKIRNFQVVEEFKKDLKKLSKFDSLAKDLEKFKDLLQYKKLFHEARIKVAPYGKEISNLGRNIAAKIYKVRLQCTSSCKGRGQSDFRLIYAYNAKANSITYLELYHKPRKEMENRERIYKYFTKRK